MELIEFAEKQGEEAVKFSLASLELNRARCHTLLVLLLGGAGAMVGMGINAAAKPWVLWVALSVSAWWQMIKKYDYRCQSCGGIYDQEELHATRMGVMFSDQPLVNLTLMCTQCKVRFHTDGAIHGGPLSTR